VNVHAIVTEKIINLLEMGVVPWRRPWVTSGLPRNLISEKPYRGVNLFLLSASKYTSPYWLTMHQANQLGGRIRKDEESTIAVFWKVEDIECDQSEEPTNDNKERRRYVLRYYRLFNLEQCELPKRITDKVPTIEMREHEPIESCAEIIGCMPNPPEIVHCGSKAYYSPLNDRVTVPPPELFVSATDYYATVLHELLHSTRAQNQTRARIDSRCYAFWFRDLQF
jgi:antirestriction protein ArdC